MGAADAVDREAAWLTTVGDGLPGLITPHGPWDLVQGYMRRTDPARKRSVYLMRTGWTDQRFTNHRRIARHTFRAVCVWPLGAARDDIAETAQRDFDAALEAVVARIRAFPDDHTHGARFLSVAEAPDQTAIRVHIEPVDHLFQAQASALGATVEWGADDPDFTA